MRLLSHRLDYHRMIANGHGSICTIVSILAIPLAGCCENIDCDPGAASVSVYTPSTCPVTAVTGTGPACTSSGYSGSCESDGPYGGSICYITTVSEGSCHIDVPCPNGQHYTADVMVVNHAHQCCGGLRATLTVPNGFGGSVTDAGLADALAPPG
jgi:hypothetical protein